MGWGVTEKGGAFGGFFEAGDVSISQWTPKKWEKMG